MNLQDIRHQTDAAQIKAYVLELENTPVLNISQVGLSLQTEHPLAIGQTYALHLKSAQERVILNAVVVRCHLSELGEGSDGIQKPLYHSGVEFHMERNPKEERLMYILQDNLYGEKRLGA